MNNKPRGPAEISEALDRERRFESLGASLSTLRVFLVLAVQCCLLLGFSLIFVKPRSAEFYVATMALMVNVVLLAGSLLRFFSVRKQMLKLSRAEKAGAAAR